MATLSLWTAGHGTRVLCVHGSASSGENFLYLAESIPGYLIVAPDRPNYGTSPESNPSSLDAETAEMVELLEDGAHLFGSSYGGVVAMLAAIRRPELVRSLTVNEPPAFQLAARHPEVRRLLDRLRSVYPPPPGLPPQQWIERFVSATGMPPYEAPLTPEDERAVVAMMREQPPWEVALDLDRLSRTPFPKLILSGGWSPAFGAVCDVLEQRLGARRIDRPGAGHGLSVDRDRWIPEVRALWQAAEA
jgi:pimeloyl-ACP methyl ester carboxylesterase